MSDRQTSHTDLSAHLEALMDAAPRVVLVIDEEGRILWVSRASEMLVGLSPEQLIGRSMLEFVVEDDLPLMLESMAYVLDQPGHFRPMEFRYRRADDTVGVLEAVSANRLDDPTIRGIVAQVHDVTPRRIFDEILESIAAGAAVNEVVRLIARQVEEQVGDARVIVGIDPVGDSFRLAASSVDIVEDDHDLVVGGEPIDRADADPETPWGRAIRLGEPVIDPDLSSLPEGLLEESQAQGFRACWAFPTRMVDDRISGCLIVWRTVPGAPSPGERVGAERAGRLLAMTLERRHTESLLLHAARHDTLTGLPNRTQFYQRLQRELVRDEHLVAVLYLDLDGFKSVNDHYGHRAGDQVLTTVATRIEEALRPDDLTARLGGDEFGVICARLHGQDEAIAIAERLIESLGRPVQLPADSIRSPEMAALAGAPVLDPRPAGEPVDVRVQVSIGIAFGPESASDHEQLVELADAAMYQAKRAGSGCWCLSSGPAPEPPAEPTRF